MSKTDRVWFITGASSGFGRALAEAVIAQGERTVVAARRREALTELEALDARRVLAVPVDVTSAEARKTAVDAALARFSRIDVLANIAGRGSLGAVEEFAPEQLRAQMELNFFAAAELTRDVLPHMRRQGAGHILNLTSIGGLISIGGFGAYCASKFALEAWSEALADEIAPLDVYRSTIAPIEEFLYGQNGRQPGDPAKAAAAMIAVVDDANPPRRLVLRADAYDAFDRIMGARMADIARYRSLGETTGFPGADVRTIGAS
jgi:NAD(P)-dependent dehydrogenase (short-subunit alcohol dehydrogenase family)